VVVTERPDLILLDVNMPGMSGLEACSKIRLSFDGPIIMVTVRNAERDKIAARSMRERTITLLNLLLSESCLPVFAPH
jgi:DNA-binding response OmpR family regulator